MRVGARATRPRGPFARERGGIPMADDAPGMRGYRSRNKSGLLRNKRDDTHIETIEKNYGVDLGARSDMHLGKYLKLHRIKSLNDLITRK